MLRPEKAVNTSYDPSACQSLLCFGRRSRSIALLTAQIGWTVAAGRISAHQGLMARTWVDGRMIKRTLLAAICLLTFIGSGARSQDHVPEPAGYRLDNYRAPTPATLAGARVLTTAEAKLYWKNGAVFVDVLPHSPRPANLPAGLGPNHRARPAAAQARRI